MREGVFPLIILLVVSGNALWLWMKSILKENGFKVNYFYGHYINLINFNSLIKNENDLPLKAKYRRIFFCLILNLILFIFAVFYMVSLNF